MGDTVRFMPCPKIPPPGSVTVSPRNEVPFGWRCHQQLPPFSYPAYGRLRQRDFPIGQPNTTDCDSQWKPLS